MDSDTDSFGFCNLDLFLQQEQLLLFALSGDVIVSLVLVVFLLMCSALVSGSEVAYFSLTHNDTEELKKENGGTPSSSRILNLLNSPAYLLATILIANNLINIAIIVFSNLVLNSFENLYPPDFKDYFKFGINTIAVTFLLVLFGEVSPKVYAKANSLALSRFMSRPLLFLRKLFYPLSSILVKSSTFLEKRLSKRISNQLSAQEIDHAIDLTVKNEQGSDQEVNILKRIIKFNNISVKQIMRSRVDTKAIDFQLEFKEVIKLVKDWGYSRVPVYDSDFDSVTGILHIKDLLPHINENKNFEWQGIINPNVMYVPESKKINELLSEFQDSRQHMAIVVDEYGGSSGIITLEDVMEEVIGEIRDEFDTKREIDFEKINDYTYIFEGKTMLTDISKFLKIDMDIFDTIRGESDSIAGMLLENFGQIPKKGRVFVHELYRFEVVSSNGRRIEKVKLTLPIT